MAQKQWFRHDLQMIEPARLTTQLHKHFSGLVAFSELSESELAQLARQLSSLSEEDAIRRALSASDVCRWRLAAGQTVWDGQISSSEFLNQHANSVVDTWQEDEALIPDHLVLEVLRGA